MQPEVQARIAELKAVVQAEAEPVVGIGRALRHALCLRLQGALLGAHAAKGFGAGAHQRSRKAVGTLRARHPALMADIPETEPL